MQHLRLLLLALLVAPAFSGCVPEGLVAEEYDPAFYQIPRQLADTLLTDPTFLVVGDLQQGYSAYENVAKKKNWMTWKQLLFPFYQVYLIGRGIGGAINYGRGVPDANEQARAMMRYVLRQEARASQVDFLVALGDLSADDGRKPDHWRLFLEEYYHDNPLLHEVPFLPTPGNHDYSVDSTYGLPNYQAVFDYPLFYVVDFPSGALFVVDSNYLVDQYQYLPDDEQNAAFERWFAAPKGSGRLSWLERELAKRKDKPFKMIAMHHAPISFSMHAKDWVRDDYGDDLVGKRARLIEVLQENGVQVVFSGHEHLYEHNVVRFEDPHTGDEQDLHFVIASGGGAVLRPLSDEATVTGLQEAYAEGGVTVLSIERRSTFHYLLVRVEPSRLVVEVYEVDDRIRERGDLMEQFVIERRETKPITGSSVE